MLSDAIIRSAAVVVYSMETSAFSLFLPHTTAMTIGRVSFLDDSEELDATVDTVLHHTQLACNPRRGEFEKHPADSRICLHPPVLTLVWVPETFGKVSGKVGRSDAQPEKIRKRDPNDDDKTDRQVEQQVLMTTQLRRSRQQLVAILRFYG